MSGLRQLAAVVLIVAGVAALVYKGFNYTTKERKAKLGPVKVSVEKTERVAVPTWLGVAMVACGAGLLVIGRR